MNLDKDFNINSLSIQDLPFIAHLQPEGWSNIYKPLLDYCSFPFCFPIKISGNNRILGLGNLIVYENTAWLSHIIVDKESRGMGIGFRIVEALMKMAEEKNIASVNLIATELGQSVYLRYGFRVLENYQLFKRVNPSNPKAISKNLKPYSRDFHAQILKMDKDITGENRIDLIQDHLNTSIVYEDNGIVEGYYLPQLGHGGIFALTDCAGVSLMELKYTYYDDAIIPVSNNVGIDFLLNNGFEKQKNTSLRMVFGKDTQWKPQHIFSRIGGNYG